MVSVVTVFLMEKFNKANTIMAEKIIPITFTKNNNKALLNNGQLNNESATPAVASGGTRETEIATPGRVSFKCGLVTAKAAAKPARAATNAYMSDCEAPILAIKVFKPSIFRPENRRPIIKPAPIANKNDFIIV